MMLEIKRALIFLWGAAYVGSIWKLWEWREGAPSAIVLVPFIFAIATSVTIGLLVLSFFVSHWGEE